MKRVTVTLSDDVVRDIEHWDSNRSRFLLEAARREIERRKREALRRSLSNPHPECGEVAELGIREWGEGHGDCDDDLLDNSCGTSVMWSPESGWREVTE